MGHSDLGGGAWERGRQGEAQTPRTNPLNSIQTSKVLGPQPSGRTPHPPPPVIWEPASSPSARLLLLLLCAPSDPLPRERKRADARGGARNSNSPLSTSPFSLLFLLSCCLSLFPFPFFSFPIPSRLLSLPLPPDRSPLRLRSSASELRSPPLSSPPP